MLTRYTQTPNNPTLPGKALIISHLQARLYLTCTPERTPELKPNYTIPMNYRKPTIVAKVSLSKRAVPTQEEHKIQLGLEIKDNNNVIDIYKQIHALTAN